MVVLVLLVLLRESFAYASSFSLLRFSVFFLLQVNNNVRCHALAVQLMDSIVECLEPKYVNQVSFHMYFRWKQQKSRRIEIAHKIVQLKIRNHNSFWEFFLSFSLVLCGSVFLLSLLCYELIFPTFSSPSEFCFCFSAECYRFSEWFPQCYKGT